MRLVTRLFPSALLALVLGATLAAAAPKPAPVPHALPPATGFQAIQAGPSTATSTCTIGETGSPTYIIDYLLPPNDAYYTLLDPAQCSTCGGGGGGGGGVLPVAAHVLLYFPEACQIPVSVGIYGAAGSAGCYTPATGTSLCPSTTTVLSPPSDGFWDFSIPMLGSCCISGPAFLKIEFLTEGDCASLPQLIVTGDCYGCQSYNIWPSGGPDDLCVDIGFPGNPNMSLDVDCCASTPAGRTSWGRLKTLYR